MMRTYSVLIFSLLLIFSVIFVSSFDSSFAEKVIGVSTGFEDSTILELKNSRGNTANIDTVRIWLSGDNEFKSFKTENGWMGKNTPHGVIIFTSKSEVMPGQSVKFGIKTTENNPVINWKALDSNNEVISSASTTITETITESEVSKNESELNKPNKIVVKSNSIFRLVPENPTSNSDFRIIGENFTPGETVEFYLQDTFKREIKIDGNGRFFSTSSIPEIENDQRMEFIIRDSSGNEKINNLRILKVDNREIVESSRLTIGNIPKEVKLGDIVNISGQGTPGTTLIIKARDMTGDIINSDTIVIKNNGEWDYVYLVSPDTNLGDFKFEINDGISKVLRGFEIINPSLINVVSDKKIYELGDIVKFSGKVIPEQTLAVSLEDPIGSEIFSDVFSINDTGDIDFEIEISKNSMEGTYIMYFLQDDDESVMNFGVGQEPETILIVKPSKLNFKADEDIKIQIKSISGARITLTLIDSSDREILSDSIVLGINGRENYIIDAGTLSNGAYVLDAQRGESTSESRFSVGFSTGSGKISLQTTKSTYEASEQILILGSTDSKNVILDISISNPSGTIIKKYETYSDKFGMFKIDNFRIPNDPEIGKWMINAKSGPNFKKTEFEVIPIENALQIFVDKKDYERNETMNITGYGSNGGFVIITINNTNGEKISELNIPTKKDGQFLTFWTVPPDIFAGEYEIIVEDETNTSVKTFRVIDS